VHARGKDLSADRSECELGRKQRLLRLQDRGVGGVTVVVLKRRKAGVIFQRRDQAALCSNLLLQLLAGNKGIGNVGKGILDRLLIAIKGRLLSGLRLRDLAAYRTEGEDRTHRLARVIPYTRWPGKEIRQVTAGAAERAGQRNRRKVKRLGCADLRIGGDELLLGLHQIRPSFQELRGDSGRHRR